MDDFFSSVVAGDESTVGTEPVDQFAEAIASRFGSGSMLTARLVPRIGTPLPPKSPRVKGPVRMPSTPMAKMSISPKSIPSKTPTPKSGPSTTVYQFIALPPSSLLSWVSQPGTLVVDIRPHASYSNARIPAAISLSVPSTLLKRPLFSLQKLTAMLPTQAARNKFSAWQSAARILVYDGDSSSIPENSNLHGLMRKFKNDGFEGELAWLQGGFQAVWKSNRAFIDSGSLSPDTETETEEEEEDEPTRPAVLRTKNLPIAAFSLASTTFGGLKDGTSRRPRLTSPGAARPTFNPFFDTIRQNVELSHGITERIALRLPRRVRRRIHELPFPWLQYMAKRAAPVTPSNHLGKRISSESESESDSDDNLNSASDIEEGAEAMAMQFYRIELAEQRRLMGVMQHHSKESVDVSSSLHSLFPFSITAGVEKGAKNRYRHIWPFEHARVRLHSKRDSDSDDYVNASYVQPLGTSKRYIATQGPLPATFSDFWTLCWEQNVHVIVMLTREVEGAQIKCGSYWTDEVYGALRLRLISTTEDVSQVLQSAGRGNGFNYFGESPFSQSGSSASSARPRTETIRRVFELSHTHYPKAGVRRIVHLQYLEWPDMNVPDDPRGILGLVRIVEAAVAASECDSPAAGSPHKHLSDNEIDLDTGMINRHKGRKQSPVLLHCSAGVGRTGGFIAVDSILDSIRRELRKKNQVEPVSHPMDVDPVVPSVTTEKATSLPTVLSQPLTAPVSVANGIVHVPFAGWGRAETIKTPMQVDTEDVNFPDTRKWAESVSDQTTDRAKVLNFARPELKPGVSAIRTTTLSSSLEAPSTMTRFPSLYVSDSDEPLPVGEIHPDPASFAASSSLASSVYFSSAKSYPPFFSYPKVEPQSKANSAPFNLGLLPPNTMSQRTSDDTRLRTFSAPSGMPFEATRTTSKASLQSSPLKPWIRGDTLVASPMPTNHSSFQVSSDSMPITSSSISRASSPPQSSYASDNPPAASLSSRPTNVDYKDPRKLHEDISPIYISGFDEPICEVVQDMREQRMSLCQSLRQYVFVYAAVIEGALMIVDEERELSKKVGEPTSSKGNMKERPTRPRVTMQNSDESVSTTSTGKRGASPTELLKEVRRGDLQLAKRPSVKRKSQHGMGDDEVESFQAASMMLSRPLPEISLPKRKEFGNRASHPP